jgi:hypothetical protein
VPSGRSVSPIRVCHHDSIDAPAGVVNRDRNPSQLLFGSGACSNGEKHCLAERRVAEARLRPFQDNDVDREIDRLFFCYITDIQAWPK